MKPTNLAIFADDLSNFSLSNLRELYNEMIGLTVSIWAAISKQSIKPPTGSCSDTLRVVVVVELPITNSDLQFNYYYYYYGAQFSRAQFTKNRMLLSQSDKCKTKRGRANLQKLEGIFADKR